MGKETNTILSNIPKNEHGSEKKGTRVNCCQYCTNNPIFPTAILLNIHIAENHKNVAVKCNLCNDVFNKFMDYYSIRRHYLRVHKNDDMLDTCLQALKESTNMNGTNHIAPAESSSGNDSVKVEDEISTSTPTEERKPGKLKTSSTPKLEVCVMCRSADIGRRSNSMFCKTCICSVNADDTSAESPDGIKQDSGRPKRKFKCRLCKQLMNKDWVTITKHFEQNHQSDYNVESKTRSRGPKNKDSDGKKSDNSIATNTNKERRTPIKDFPSSKSTNIKETLSSPTAATYKCVHCDTSTDDRKVFRTHIAIHKDDPNGKQCPDCGECFVVNATCSLAKHLLKIHNVRNLKKYFIENDLLPKKQDLNTKTSEGLKDDHSKVGSSKSDPKRSCDAEHDEADNHSNYDVRNETETKQSEVQDNENEKPKDGTGNVVKKRRRSVKNGSSTKSKKTKNEQNSSPTKSSYECVYCKLTTDNREEFQTHIISHKDGPDDRQCPECGECYAKAVCSLAKHILIAHDVRNLRAYFMENNLLTPEELHFIRKRSNNN